MGLDGWIDGWLDEVGCPPHWYVELILCVVSFFLWNIIIPNKDMSALPGNCVYRRTTDLFGERYYVLVSHILGRGRFGIVRICTQRRTGYKFAVKSIKKCGINDCRLYNEIGIMGAINHVNIVKMIDYYEEPRHVHIVMEKYSGGDLLEKMECMNDGCFTEQMASSVVKSLLSALTYLNDKRIVHRDIKLENVLFDGCGCEATVKLVDFGLSRFHKDDDDKMTSLVGTVYYISPEQILGKYDKSVDIWAVGVVMYILLSACMPFFGDNDREIFYSTLNNDLDLSSPSVWGRKYITSKARDLLQWLLVKDPRERISTDEALIHPWLS